MVDKSQERTGWKLWASYAVIAWCALFGGLHIYWGLGGNAGLAEWSIPSNQTVAVTRASAYIGLTWVVGLMCAVGAIAALVLTQPWGRRIPRWLPLTPLWIACGLCLVRGIGNPVQTLLVLAGVVPFEPFDGPLAIAWYRWLLLDALLFSPWFTLGGLAFGATAWPARRPGSASAAHRMVTEGQQA